MPEVRRKPRVLIIRDGWGQNLIQMGPRQCDSSGHCPVADALMKDYPNTLIHTSGEDVGLPGRCDGEQRSGSPEHPALTDR